MFQSQQIAWVNPILHVTYAHGRQYKYRGHTIKFSQDINSIVKNIPWWIEDLGIFIVRIKGSLSKHYDCIVSRSWIMNY